MKKAYTKEVLDINDHTLVLQSSSYYSNHIFILYSCGLCLMRWIIGILIGVSIGITIGFSIYHYFFMAKFSCCGVYG